MGKSDKVTGPYLDKNGNDLNSGTATLVLEGKKDWPGVGHNSTYTFDGMDYLVFHGYDANDNGRSKLIVRKLFWDEEGWPVVIED